MSAMVPPENAGDDVGRAHRRAFENKPEKARDGHWLFGWLPCASHGGSRMDWRRKVKPPARRGTRAARGRRWR